MKYANLAFNGMDSYKPDRKSGGINLGDNIQILSMLYLYSLMGVDRSDIVEVNFYELPDYDGENVVLPINFVFATHFPGVDSLRFSEKITPVFLGLSLEKTELSQSEQQLLKRYEPVGCRDEHTLNTMGKYGVRAYLNGCLTSVLPRRKHFDPLDGKVFYVDAPAGLISYLPDGLRKRRFVVTSHKYFGELKFSRDSSQINDVAKKQLEWYAREAEMVITSRLHVAAPCMAMGIPVILAVKNCSYRFGWLEKFLPIYSEAEFASINWNPSPISYEDKKRYMADIAIERIRGAYAVAEYGKKMNAFYESREPQTYSELSYAEEAKKFIKEQWSLDDEFSYAFWGLTETAGILYEFIGRNYPNARLCAFYDTYKDFDFNGVKSTRPAVQDNVFTFVTADSACEYAEAFFSEQKIPSSAYFLCHNPYVTEALLEGKK